MGGHIYALIGICVGCTASLLVAYKATEECAPMDITASFSLLLGALAGLFWPTTIIVGVWWLVSGSSDDDDEGDGRRLRFV